IVGKQGRLQIALKGVCIAAQDALRTDGEGIEVSEDRFEGPVVRFDKGIAANLFKTALLQYPLRMLRAATGHMRCGDAPRGDSSAGPLVDGLGDNILPGFPVAGTTASSDNGQAAPRPQPEKRLLRHHLLIEPV